MLHIKKDDTVMITVGKDRGKTGKVLRVFPKRQRALVEKLNLV
ncbi:MAG: KOW motif-containing protein, partial [Candidatus Omnitrophota bacterium]|nr:KOW motif-containing protein [Candidatus Omnitrophota bacterium]